MNYDPLDARSYEEWSEFRYYSRAADGDTIHYTRRIEEPGFDTLLHAFLDWAQAIYAFDRKDIKLKALESAGEWEV